ncbi:MAG: hypothetical protein COW67_01275 [Flavobacteriales bacterium CG18_big_fil_WC_8_21_14_2_50_32_9]|nr:MAG: hypothetical protein COW67_01275 [Flavobacteriales bacterium CG18_big_fil_WC_8_21_14_2_50_32_9]
MDNNQQIINKLIEKLELLFKKHEQLSQEIHTLNEEINSLKNDGFSSEIIDEKIIQPTPEIEIPAVPLPEKEKDTEFQDYLATTQAQIKTAPKTPQKSNIEKFIGENLINKIGIVITVIGVAIGAKYSIENELISPLTRIILGYLTGIALMVVGIKLKKNFTNYSAVLVSGAIAIMYFITFAAYSFYGLFPQLLTFALMVVFTIFAVIAALNYNQQVIAHIGLVGAYAVPFLLSDGSGKVLILFSYMAIINIGILIISFKKYWKSIFYSSFSFTWLIFLSWYGLKYELTQHFQIALWFSVLFFVIFYVTFLAFKLIKKEKFLGFDIVMLLANSFVFYGVGYSIFDGYPSGISFLGAFTLINAIIHFSVSTLLYKLKLADKNLFYLILGLVLTFITIAIPVQLDGNWVTMIWSAETLLLFWIGRTKNVPIYEKLSFPLIALAFFSLVHDWDFYRIYYYSEKNITPIFNIAFLTTCLFIISLVLINLIDKKNKLTNENTFLLKLSNPVLIASKAILLFTLYYVFVLEIKAYWEQPYISSISLFEKIKDSPFYANFNFNYFKTIWIINFSLLFAFLLTIINTYKLKNKIIGITSLILSGLTLIAFIFSGLYYFGELRESYLSQELAAYYEIGKSHILIRYISFFLLVLLFIAIYKQIKQAFANKKLYLIYGLTLHFTIICVLSNEFIHWMELMHSTQSYKLGLSILWGVYALFLIILGIWKHKQYLRIAAIVLFSITLIKLFFYDISNLNTIAKTIVFVSLGVLLLIISFLYTKYKSIISPDDKN